MELVLHVLAQSCETAGFFIRAPPGEVVAAGVVAEAEAAGRVGFNCACLRRRVDEEADLSRHSMNTQTHTLPTVVLRCVFFDQQPAGVCILAAAERHLKALQVVERLQVVLVRHQAGDVDGAEAASINLRQSTPRRPAPGNQKKKDTQ